jgi:hypothetical protein
VSVKSHRGFEWRLVASGGALHASEALQGQVGWGDFSTRAKVGQMLVVGRQGVPLAQLSTESPRCPGQGPVCMHRSCM